ncbi:allergen protein [Rhizoctonia solani 123E]|uniref:Allergen protein n=1 Tax=Rhizoctonia solani 123E TaxID=1423351 RepID=A0A074S0P0_9AGAM|nr:allergen protein [Rhizoctonia solani 123E]
MLLSAVFMTLSATLAFASPLEPRAAPDNTVLVESTSKYCMIMPRIAHTNIGDSESEGQMQSYCSASARYDNSQGKLPNNFWKKVTYKKGRGKGDWVQLTGCINKGFSQLNDNDGGGQYDSTGGAGSAGNPRGSKCQNYNHYVEIVEPDVGRAFCLILPRVPGATVGESESPGQMQSFCSPSAYTDSSQGQLPGNFWRSVTYATGTGSSGQSYAQLTGCINLFPQLNPNDGGGQYDSSGGDGGRGNPEGSVCEGYAHYVELLEPSTGRACIRCCQDTNDCPLSMDTSGCPAVIPGTYSGC